MITLALLIFLVLAACLALWFLTSWKRKLDILPPPDPKTKRSGTECVP